MNRLKFRRNTSRLILVLASLLTLIVIVMTGVSSYAATPDVVKIVEIKGTGLVFGVGNNPRTPANKGDEWQETNKILYVPGGNKPWAHLVFLQAAPLDHTELLVQAGPSETVSEWSFPCKATGGRFKIAWKKGSDRGCEPEGVKLQSSNKRSSLPNIKNNLQASRRLLAQAQDEVTVVPTPGESVIQTADNAAGIVIDVLIGEVRIKSEKNPGGRLVKAGEKYAYPQDTITPIDQNSILNSPEMQEFLNHNNWRSPGISDRIIGGIVGQLRELRTALAQSQQSVVSNLGNNNLAQKPIRIGQCTITTSPPDPSPRQSYMIIVSVPLPYTGRSNIISGSVRGTDEYLADFSNEINTTTSDQVVHTVPGGEASVRDTITLTSPPECVGTGTIEIIF